MKKTTFLLFALLCASTAHATNLWLDIKQNTKFEPLNNLQPSTFYNLKDKTRMGGVLTEVLSYRCFGQLFGVVKDLDTGKSSQFVGAIGLKLDYFLSMRQIVPDDATLVHRTTIGPFLGYDFRHDHWVYGIAGTVKFDVPK